MGARLPILLVSLSACASTASSTPTGGRASHRTDPILVRSSTAVMEIDPEGAVRRTLFEGNVVTARVHPSRKVLAVVTARPLRVQLVDLETGVARASEPLIGSPACERESFDSPYVPPWGLEFDRGGEAICLSVEDSSIEELSSVVFTVRLSTAGLQMEGGEQTIGEDVCPLSFSALPEDCRSPPVSSATQGEFPFAYQPGVIVRRTAGSTDETFRASPVTSVAETVEGLVPEEQGLSSFSEWGRTRDGRWTILRGNRLRGDVLHDQVLVFDAQTGQIFPVPSAPTSDWPAPLSRSELSALTADRIETRLVVPDWEPLATDQFTEGFAIGDILYQPGRDARALPGVPIP